MEELIKFYLDLLKNWGEILNKYELFLGGGTALMLKYKHRLSYDLDFFVFKEIDLGEVLRELAFSLPYNFDFAIEFPILIVSNKRFSTKIEIHKRNNVKLLGYEEIFGIKKMSDLDILLEKIYFIERNKEADIFDIKFLLDKLRISEEEIVKKLVEKFSISKEYATYLWDRVKSYLS